MSLSWNEIRSRAVAFSQEYKGTTRENAETQSFYNDFFNIFGISRRRVATFEEPVKKLGTRRGRIDLFWKGVLLIEHKSFGKDLGAAYSQALDYFPNLKEEELPRYILVSDFQHFELYDLETGAAYKFTLPELHQNVELFGFIAGYQKREFKDQDPVNIEASERMGKLHDMLKDSGYTGHELELLLVRLLFCLFADDTGIFEKGILYEYLEQRTIPDGSDLGARLIHLFQILNTPPERRQRNLDETLARFPYINGSLFADMLSIPDFNGQMRASLLSACLFDWGRISPAIFGSLFQSVMDKEKRRGIGAHYTSEKNILKVIKPLFLDALWSEFETIKRDRRRLQEFHVKLSRLAFLDPACGCGNFLILAYRELRLLEIEVLKALYPGGQLSLFDVSGLSLINVDAFYGIEVEEFPARIAEVALWLMDHQMNMQLSEAFGVYYARIPLKASAHIHHANALHLEWAQVIQPERLSYILGNPPFIGHQWRNAEQMKDMDMVWTDSARAGRLDYVTCWFKKAAEYMTNAPTVKAAFVSTNSITQGEQPAILWAELSKLKVKILFAHRTFRWKNDARGNAAVHVVIIGLGVQEAPVRLLFDYSSLDGEPHVTTVPNINGYLVAGQDVILQSRGKNLSGLPEMFKGSQPTDGGHLLLTESEKDELIRSEPLAAAYIKQFVGSDEFIKGKRRYCLWLKNASPNDLRKMPLVLDRIEKVRQSRLKSPTPSVRTYAKYPSLFTQDRQPLTQYLAIPEVSSENRHYIPIGFLSPDVICSNKLQIIPDASLFLFGVLQSEMHMVWVRYTCGRLKSDYSYSPAVYNNFPWPQPNDTQMATIETAAQWVLDARTKFPGSTLADLYDPNTMPPELAKAHQALDRAVDSAYRRQPFNNERQRVEYLFSLYQQLTAPLMTEVDRQNRKRKS